MMKTYLQQQRKQLNQQYIRILKRIDLCEKDFDFLMQNWIEKNERLEKQEELYQKQFLKQVNHLPCFSILM